MTIIELKDNISITTTINCSICIDEVDIKDIDNTKILNCSNKHIFHKLCINEWLNVNKICPLCREEIQENNVNNVNNVNQINNIMIYTTFVLNILLLFLFVSIIGTAIHYMFYVNNIDFTLYHFNNVSITEKPPIPINFTLYILMLILLFLSHLSFTMYFLANKFNIICIIIFFNIITFSIKMYYTVIYLIIINFYKEHINDTNDKNNIEKINKISNKYNNIILYNWGIILLYYSLVLIKYKIKKLSTVS